MAMPCLSSSALACLAHTRSAPPPIRCPLPLPLPSAPLQLKAAGVGVLAVGLGEPEKARKFAELLGFPQDILYAGELIGASVAAVGCCASFSSHAAAAAALPATIGCSPASASKHNCIVTIPCPCDPACRPNR